MSELDPQTTTCPGCGIPADAGPCGLDPCDMRQQQITTPRGWNPPATVPEDGSEFDYLCTDGRVRTGSLGSDMGGSIKRDSRMTGWRKKL